jgi:ribosomal protein S18 acetylase RimI-like enzyme
MENGEISSRAWSGPEDLGTIEELISAAWNGPSRPRVNSTVGDLEWWIASLGPDADLAARIRLWFHHGSVAGWGWLSPRAELHWMVADGLPGADEARIRDSILAWNAERAPAMDTPDGPPAQLAVSGADGWSESAHLVARGWTPTDEVFTQYHQRLDLDLDPPRVPEGYVLRTLRGPEDIPRRVDVHRAAFAPSKMTAAKYELLVRQPHYAFDRDIVVEAPDGSFAAFAMGWMDPVGRVGEFEPVGVHPDHQRRGLGRVVMRHGLRLMRAAGMLDAIVFSLRTNAASEALYRSAGFDELALHRRYTMALPAARPIP